MSTSWRVACLRSPDERHHWLPFKRQHVMGAPTYTRQFNRRVLSSIRFHVTCRHCLFRTPVVIDFIQKEIRIST